MVKITNGKETFEVTSGAYKSLFIHQGYRIVDENKKNHSEASDCAVENNDDNKDEANNVSNNEETNIVSDNKEAKNSAKNKKPAKNKGLAEWVEELKEKPISQWTKDEIIKFAKVNNIDISSTEGPAQAKAIIKKYLNQ